MSAAAHQYNPPPSADVSDEGEPDAELRRLKTRWATILARCERADRHAADVLRLATILRVTPAPTATCPQRVHVTLQTTVFSHIQFLRREPAHLRAIEATIAQALGRPAHVRLEMLDELLDEHQRRWQECVIR